jgi:arginyl-tRNA synthetase
MPKETARICQKISDILHVKYDEVEQVLTTPKESTHGDYTVPLFSFAKKSGTNPAQLAQTIVAQFSSDDIIQSVHAVGPYVNIFLQKAYLQQSTISEVLTKQHEYGSFVPLVSYTYALDFSSPNIAKPMHIGHLRSTIIGSSVKRILTFCGHRVVGINYLGDWGTQFGKILVAQSLWGDATKLAQDPIGHLLEIYVKFHQEEEKNPELLTQARELFARLEQNDPQLMQAWQSVRDFSVSEFKKIYEFMGIEFDEYSGESVYNTHLESMVEQLKKGELLTESDGCLIIDFKARQIDLPPLIIIKSNGASTYALRDMCAAVDREKKHMAEFLLYETSSEQKLHFQQVFAALRLLGQDIGSRAIHIDHGMYKFKDEKFSTRQGNVIYLTDVLAHAVAKAKALMQEKNAAITQTPQFESVAKAVGLGAVYFMDLASDRVHDVQFDWDKALDFSGDSGPYVQYTHARICSMLKKYGKKLSLSADYGLLTHDKERVLALHLQKFSQAIDTSARQYKPHHIARYLLDTCQLFNTYYQEVQIISEDEKLTQARVLLCAATRQVLANGLYLLGMESPTSM